MKKNRSLKKIKGFSIVEILVVISVIGILAAISYVGYGAWQKSAKVTQIKNEFNMAAAAMENYRNFNDAYPLDVNTVYTPSQGTIITGGSWSDGYVIASQNGTDTYSMTNTSGFTVGGNINSSKLKEDLIVWFDATDAESYSGTGSTWKDLIGSNDATLQNVAYSSGVGGALVFNGTNSSGLFNRPVTDDFTMMYWFKTTQTSDARAQWYNGKGMLDCEVNIETNDFGSSMADGKVMFGVGSPDRTISSPGRYNDGAWHLFTATREKSSGNMHLYVDGVLVGSDTNVANNKASLTACANLEIGAIQAGGSYFSGNINDIRIYNTVLAGDLISESYSIQKVDYGL